MHIHICPVEITAALMVAEQGVPYVKYSLCYHAENIKNKLKNRSPITIWKRLFHDEAEFNHIEDGWCQNDHPTANSKEQEKSWKGEWDRTHGYLVDGVVEE